MSWFARIEETCAAFIERAFANMFPSDLEPAHIARKLVSTMEARTQSAERAMVAPAVYTVYVSTADYSRLRDHREYLEREWSALLADVAGRVGIRFADALSVSLREEPAMVAGAIHIAAHTGPGRADDANSAATEFSLRVVKGMPASGVFHVSGASRVGRSAQCDVFLVDPSVSRSHALLDVREGALVVRDAGSSNGTFVNGERIQLRTVHPGDTVAFGKTEMLVESP